MNRRNGFSGMLLAVASSLALVPALAGAGGPLVVSVAPEPLAAEKFRPFGQVVEVPKGRAPSFKNGVLRFWGGLAKTRIHERIEFGVMTVKSRVREVAEMQRHAGTPKFLVSLNTDFHLVVAPSEPPKASKAQPKASEVRVFVIKQGQAVVLHKRIWHSPPFPEATEGQFIVAFRDETRRRDHMIRAFRSREVVKF